LKEGNLEAAKLEFNNFPVA